MLRFLAIGCQCHVSLQQCFIQSTYGTLRWCMMLTNITVLRMTPQLSHVHATSLLILEWYGLNRGSWSGAEPPWLMGPALEVGAHANQSQLLQHSKQWQRDGSSCRACASLTQGKMDYSICRKREPSQEHSTKAATHRQPAAAAKRHQGSWRVDAPPGCPEYTAAGGVASEGIKQARLGICQARSAERGLASGCRCQH